MGVPRRYVSIPTTVTHGELYAAGAEDRAVDRARAAGLFEQR